MFLSTSPAFAFCWSYFSLLHPFYIIQPCVHLVLISSRPWPRVDFMLYPSSQCIMPIQKQSLLRPLALFFVWLCFKACRFAVCGPLRLFVVFFLPGSWSLRNPGRALRAGTSYVKADVGQSASLVVRGAGTVDLQAPNHLGKAGVPSQS